MSQYDFIIAGGGAAGLSLAYHLLHSPLRDHSILIVDKDAKERNDRTFAFWTDRPTVFDDIVYRSWNQLRFAGDHFAKVIPLGAFRYQMIRGIDFYRCMRRELWPRSNVEILHGRVDRVDDGDEGAGVWVEGQMYTGRWVFDSRFSPSQLEPDPAHYHYLRQHFQGWVIETPGKAFDPQIATFLDFRTPQKNEMRFFYVLPFSERQALVEYVLFSRDDCEQTLKDYLASTLGIKEYRIVAREGGINPLTDWPFPRRLGRRLMAIGTLGGMVKPSSGYAFTRIQADSAAIVQSLLQAGHPFDLPAALHIYRLCDALMLHVMAHHSEQAKPIFTAMFENNPIERIFRFLDETTSPGENLALIASLPPWLFVRAWFEMKVLGRFYRPRTKHEGRINNSDFAIRPRCSVKHKLTVRSNDFSRRGPVADD